MHSTLFYLIFMKGGIKVKKWFLRLAPLVLALVMVCGSCLTVFAAEIDYSSGPSGCTYQIVVKRLSDDATCVFTSDSRFVYCYYSSGNGGYVYCPGNFDIWVNGSVNKTLSSTTGIPGEYSILSTNFDMLDENGEVFFQQPPDPPTLAPIAETAGMSGVLEQLMMILPIGLVCLVGWIALRKALKILPQILHRA